MQLRRGDRLAEQVAHDRKALIVGGPLTGRGAGATGDRRRTDPSLERFDS